MTSIYNAIGELEKRHIQYIEANYHLHHPRLIKERNLLMREGNVSSESWIEATPIYVSGKKFSEMNLPQPIINILNKLSEKELIIPRPYLHQEEALNAFFNENKNLIVSTGTGSGKTEIFIYSILGALALEAERKKTIPQRGFRAIILYPMNALVSDQLSRLRKLFGSDQGSQELESMFGRRIQFGMYTSRTPYHGQYNKDKNNKIVKPLIDYYRNLQQLDPDSYNILKLKGKIPVKDLIGFSGGRERNSRYRTQPKDVELFTRQEMHSPNKYGGAPDILITNYSMLEFMLIRPIEQSLFESTRKWLNQDLNNQLLIVIDEAHLYRGAQGAEVALLIRRLLQHLQISQSRVRFILTSASLGSNEVANKIGPKFASDLTGVPSEQYKVILGTKRELGNGAKGDIKLAQILESINYNYSYEKVKPLIAFMKWPEFDGQKEKFEEYLGTQLYKNPTFKYLHDCLRRGPIPIKKLSKIVFPKIEEKTAIEATLNLLFLSNQSLISKSQILMPVRVHTFFKGLPKQYACINPNCTCRREKGDNHKLLGKIYTEPRFLCECGSRVFELLSHRTCGAAYIKAYRRIDDRLHDLDPMFLWSYAEENEDLEEIHILVESPNVEYHRDLVAQLQSRYLDIKTGHLTRVNVNKNDERFIIVWIPGNRDSPSEEGMPWSWTRCPVCGISENRRFGRTQIMDLETKGEETFANLVTTLFKFQPEDEKKKDFPNKGKKVLCFSDSRQKSARLARDLQRTVELDSFREIVVKAINDLPKNSSLLSLYPQIILSTSEANIALFDDGDAIMIAEGHGYDGSRSIFVSAQNRLSDLKEIYSITSKNELINNKQIIEELNRDRPRQYDQALLRLLGAKNYSINALLIGYLCPIESALKQIEHDNPKIDKILLREIIISILNKAAEERAYDPDINPEDRRLSRATNNFPDGFPRNGDVEGLLLEEIIPEKIREKINNVITNEQYLVLRSSLIRSGLFIHSRGRHYINPSNVTIELALNKTWYRCKACLQFFAIGLANHCPDCGAELEELREDDPHMVTRKSFFREPCIDIVNNTKLPFIIRSEEHSAQLSHRDNSEIFSKTEKYELLFQDIILNEDDNNNQSISKQPIDVLSCTTTMEVGIDIGSLTGVAMRTVPPRPENYQQRAGRAGRRGSSLSTIITFSDNSPHESYYFANPQLMIGAPASELIIYVGNKKICERHINASLIQKFFHRNLDNEIKSPRFIESDIFSSLGLSHDFFLGTGNYSFPVFENWINDKVLTNDSIVTKELALLLPNALLSSLQYSGDNWREQFIKNTAKEFLYKLNELSNKDWNGVNEKEIKLLDTLLDAALLPTFSFPIDVCTFTVRDLNHDRNQVITKYEMSQSLKQALSEYIPGRQIVVDKKTFTSKGIYVPLPDNSINRASGTNWNNLELINYCRECKTILGEHTNRLDGQRCPICNSEIQSTTMYTPLGFSPEVDPNRGVLQGERQEGERYYASPAQFPLPIAPQNELNELNNKKLKNGYIIRMPNQELFVVNFGPEERGFDICQLCGFVADRNGLRTPHNRPYPLVPWNRGNYNSRTCRGAPINTTLGYKLRTDLAVLQLFIKSPIQLSREDAWFEASIRSLLEALVLGAARTLGVDNNELAGGYRLYRQFNDEDKLVRNYIELFLYDTTPSGAGFSSKAYDKFDEVMNAALQILSNCNCSQSCHSCLRTYNNRLWHNILDRNLGKALLEYVMENKLPSLDNNYTKILKNQLQLTLKLMNENVTFSPSDNPKILKTKLGDRTINILFKNCLLEHSNYDSNKVEVSDYDIKHNLPRIAHEIIDKLEGNNEI